jgi:trehalose utilization protein
MPKVTVWNEHLHEQRNPKVAAIYPKGIHKAIAGPLKKAGLKVGTATLEDAEHGLSQKTLDATDVLIWWGHLAHDQVSDPVVERVYERVMQGMGLIVLHSGHFSKIFRRLMGTTCALKWREANDRERMWVVSPGHPIVEGLGERITLEAEEMYGEFFDIPEPDELVLVSWFSGGEVFRSGCCFKRGFGRIFYFRPGHETYPTYHHPEIQRVILNAVRWAAPDPSLKRRVVGEAPNAAPLEKLP